MGKLKKALRGWQRVPRKTRQQIKRKVRGIVGRSSDSSKKNQK